MKSHYVAGGGGTRLHVRPPFEQSVTRDIERYFDHYGTVRFANYPVGELRDAPLFAGAR